MIHLDLQAKTVHHMQQSSQEKNEDVKEFTTATSSRYGQSHSIDKKTYHQQKQADSEIHLKKKEGLLLQRKQHLNGYPTFGSNNYS